MNGQTPMGLAAAAAAAVRPCRRRLLSSASVAASKTGAGTATPLFPRLPHPPYGRRLPFLVSAASQTGPDAPPTHTTGPVPSDPRAAVSGNLPFFDRVLFPDSFPIETPPAKEDEDAAAASAPAQADEAVAPAPPVREETEAEREAWRLLRRAVVCYCGEPVGTVAAEDPESTETLNYDQVFIRDFVPSALAFLMRGETEIVRNFLLHTLQLQSWEKTVDCYSPGQGLMPASFKIRTVPLDENNEGFEEVLDPDFGEAAIGRVAPVDSGLWWIILLRAYCKITGDYDLLERVDVQTGIQLILSLCLSDGFDMFPTLLVTDGSCMIDRRMGIHGHPLEIQALFYSALRCSREMLVVNDGSKNLIRAVNNRLSALSFHIREYYWVDMKKINEIYRYKTEEYSHDATNKFNIYPEQIPSWLVDWIPEKGGYLIGNLQPAHMDFRFFSLGNLWAIASSLTTPRQAEGILSLIEEKWDDLVANMPLKICYPAMEDDEWRIITGSDPKNTYFVHVQPMVIS
ncbi:hypothetical protein PVAP13_5KG254300 [Panicum virgatum]|uniref:Alkaline/neutral invertase n=1 Tax=Panicum virgatum TaxID=38727 RepID=A0A8T0SDL3_PANVG|nr:hypothetical protein PVAP13_5KG254300 [Panicum virgatum]